MFTLDLSDQHTDAFQKEDCPWLDIRLPEDIIEYLWHIINHNKILHADASKSLAGNITKSEYLEDPDNLFYKNVLEEYTNYVFYKEWKNYYEIHMAKIIPPPTFSLTKLWVNYQKQYEFNPPHAHEGVFSFVVFMKIPTHWKEQHSYKKETRMHRSTNTPCASDFQFLLGDPSGQVHTFNFPLSSEDEGRMLFFPAWMKHQVFPFYGTEEDRITISGNIIDIDKGDGTIAEKEQALAEMKKRVISMSEIINFEKLKYDQK